MNITTAAESNTTNEDYIDDEDMEVELADDNKVDANNSVASNG